MGGNQKSISSLTNCYACMGCLNVCPNEAIALEIDEKTGLSYPQITLERCRNCGICLKVCKSIVPSSNLHNCYVLETKDDRIHLSSSSGGAFYSISDVFLKNYSNSYVYGVKYDRNLRVIHDCVNAIEDVHVFQKSKYISSDLNNSFCKIKEQLNGGSFVLFSGTPCQVHGLKKYLGKDYEGLLTIDLICTGVMYPRVFELFLQSYSGIEIESFDWRYKHKEKNGAWNIMDSCIVSNGTVLQDEKSVNLKRLYGKHHCYKPSCYECRYASANRYSDITLGDYWAEKSFFLDSPNRGTSAIIVNSTKGEKIIELLKEYSTVDIAKLDFNLLIMQNPSLSKCVTKPKSERKIQDALCTMSMENFLTKYTRDPIISRIKMLLARIIPNSLLKHLKKLREGR